MTRRLGACVLALALSACAPTPPPPLTQAAVQDFVREYVAATNAADASKMMEVVLRDQTVSSINNGRIDRGWDAIRVATDENVVATAKAKLTVGTIDVTPLGTDAALAVASMSISLGTPVQTGRTLTMGDVPGALTILVKRTPEGLRLIHEHYSARTP